MLYDGNRNVWSSRDFQPIIMTDEDGWKSLFQPEILFTPNMFLLKDCLFRPFS